MAWMNDRWPASVGSDYPRPQNQLQKVGLGGGGYRLSHTVVEIDIDDEGTHVSERSLGNRFS